MSNSLPGNPYSEALATMLRDGALSHESLSILALAYEKRTATLVAIGQAFSEYGQRELGAPFIEEAGDRLGLDGDDA